MRYLGRPPVDYAAIEHKRIALEWFHYVTSQASETQLRIECWVRYIATQSANVHHLQSILVSQNAPRTIRQQIMWQRL
jgi:hypothetical protein